MRSLVRPSCLLLLCVLAPVHAGQFGTERFVEYRPGELPLVLTSPHGGNLTPDSIPDRKVGVTSKDMFTQELTLAISDALQAATGRRPHVIMSHLHRGKLDPNREIKEAAAGQPAAERGVRAVPSPPEPRPENHPYFSGGYIVHAHARDPATPGVDGVQFEHPRPGLRDTAANRARYAAIAAEVLRVFLRERYGYEPTPTAPGQ